MATDSLPPNFNSRRNFLRAGVTATLATAAYPALGAARVVDPESSPAAAVIDANFKKDFELDEISIDDLQKGFLSGQYSSRSLAEKYLARIQEIDKAGPMVNSVIELNPEALQIADALDQERKAKGPRGPLHGIPVLIKDNIDTGDRMNTTAGSLALLGGRPANDAFVAAQLRNAGAVILGKTNLSEWANIRCSHSTSGWSGRADLLATLMRSTAIPVDLAPELALLSPRISALPGWARRRMGRSCVRLLRTVWLGLNLRLGWSAAAGSFRSRTVRTRQVRWRARCAMSQFFLAPWRERIHRIPRRRTARANCLPDYTKFLDPAGLKGARLGVVRKYFGFNDAVDQLMDSLLGEMKRAGAEIVDPADIPTIGKFDESELTVFYYELKADLAAYLARRGSSVKSLKDVIEFNELNRGREMPYFGQDIFLKSEQKGPLGSKEYLDALALNHQLTRAEGIDFVMDKFKLDALVAPTGGPAWITDLINGDHVAGGSSSAAAVAGYPNINVTAGYLWGLPVGISFFGRAWSEPTLLKIAYSFEQLTKARQKPRFLPTIDLKAS